MNRRIIELGAPDDAGRSSFNTWASLRQVAAPVIAAWGDLDVAADTPFYEETVRRLGQGSGRVLAGVAHLSKLERSDIVADLVREATKL